MNHSYLKNQSQGGENLTYGSLVPSWTILLMRDGCFLILC